MWQSKLKMKNHIMKHGGRGRGVIASVVAGCCFVMPRELLGLYPPGARAYASASAPCRCGFSLIVICALHQWSSGYDVSLTR